MTDAGTRERLDAELALAEAELRRSSDPKEAIGRLSAAERYFDRIQTPVSRVPILVDRATLALQVADSDAADRDLERATELLESQAAHAELRDRATLLRTRRDVYHLMLSTALARGDSLQVLEIALRSRGDMWRGVEELQRFLETLPRDEARVQFAQLEDRLVMLVFTRRGYRILQDTVPRIVMRRTVERFVNAVRRGDPDVGVREAASPLHTLLVIPLREELREVRRLVLLPDAELDRIPFAALPARERLLQEMSRHDLVHFAGHARVVASDPSRSHLVLAASGGGFDDNVLYASDVATLPLHAVRLVLLSACGPTDLEERATPGLNERGLPDAFLRAGAGGVISSLWEADDAGTARLMREVHRAIRRGESLEEALRGAQLLMLRSGGAAAIRVWAAFRFQHR